MESRLINCDPNNKNAVLPSINIRPTQNDLDKLVENNAKGAAVRSTARWMEYREKNTKYFLGLKKRNREKNLLIVLKMRKEKYLLSRSVY